MQEELYGWWVLSQVVTSCQCDSGPAGEWVRFVLTFVWRQADQWTLRVMVSVGGNTGEFEGVPGKRVAGTSAWMLQRGQRNTGKENTG